MRRMQLDKEGVENGIGQATVTTTRVVRRDKNCHVNVSL
jgi:hypothetical protein